MALFGPARPPGLFTRLLRRLVDPRVYLKAVIAIGFLGLFLLPTAADLLNAALKQVSSEDGTCRILNVIDGDTVTLMCQEQGIERARILGFDTPEKYGPRCVAEFVAAEKATWALRTLIRKADRVSLQREGLDQYGRTLVRLLLDGKDVTGQMVRAGHARTYNGGPRGSWC